MNNMNSLNDTIQALSPQLRELSDAIWNHPELAYNEYFASEKAAAFLREQNFETVSKYCQVDTAFMAHYGEGTPSFAIFAEYDALPDIGHGCGHNLICTAAAAAFCAVAAELKKQNLPGRIVLLGSPAEESGGGKIKLINGGALKDIGAAMMVHPSFRTVPDAGSSAITRYTVTFHGKAAHAAGSPELGINALSAVNLLFAGVNAYREHIPEDSRMHGIILEGGEAPNIVPSKAVCRFFLRATSQKWINIIEKRFLDMVRGAELMTGATAEVELYNVPYMANRPNAALNRAYLEGISFNGMQHVIPEHGSRGSSDFGNVAQTVPGIHPYFAVTTEKIALHSTQFRDAAITDLAFENTLKAASAMAHTALKYLTESDFRQEVHADFASKN